MPQSAFTHMTPGVHHLIIYLPQRVGEKEKTHTYDVGQFGVKEIHISANSTRVTVKRKVKSRYEWITYAHMPFRHSSSLPLNS